ncbi:MAG: Crp/Fnr family transcriptional regulator [Thermodesulfovibrionales bacterium]|nr:Crp/Fnr family transcriptional regulator [Thermodesulfovibrionales bacterium]
MKERVLDLVVEIIFGNLSHQYRKILSKEFQIKRFKKGDVIFYQSDQSTDLYIVLDGSVKASLLNEEGDELTLAEFKKGDFFGEMSLIDGKPRSATVTALEDSELAILTRERFIDVLKKEPSIALELLSTLVERLRTANGVIESLAFLDVEDRLVKLFSAMLKECGERVTPGFYKVKKYTHRELASKIGASREAVTKALKALSFRGLLKEMKDGYLLSHKIFSDNAEYRMR